MNTHNEEKVSIKPAANLIFKSIYMLDEARHAIGIENAVNFERIFSAPASFDAFFQGLEPSKVSEAENEASIKGSYDTLPPEHQKLYHCFRVTFKSEEERDAFVSAQKSSDLLESISNDHEIELCNVLTPPNDSQYGELWGYQKINTNSVLDCSCGCGQVVAIVDTGIDVTHPDLAHQMWEWSPGIHGVNVAAFNLNITDSNSHGTHVAGTVAAKGNNHYGVIGVAPCSKLMAIRIFDPNHPITSTVAANGVMWAANLGADVINCSWGAAVNFDPTVSAGIAFAIAQPQKPVIVAAAGNNNFDAFNFYPASDPRVICVAATTPTDSKAGFSNFGNVVDVSAPGEDIYSTLPVSMGAFGFKSGTSMAAPHVSAMVAIIRAKLAGLTQAEYMSIVQTYVEPVNSSVPMGAGRIDFKYLKEMLCGCGCSPCGYAEVLEERRLMNAKKRKFFTITGNSNSAAATATGASCIPIQIPVIKPNFSFHWGDSANDQIETHDTEIVYITACNPYCNVSFKDLKIIAIRITPNSVLPNGEMAVELAASSLICYGDLGPSECATREYALITGNTAPGSYVFEFDYCIGEIELNAHHRGKNSFTVNMVNS